MGLGLTDNSQLIATYLTTLSLLFVLPNCAAQLLTHLMQTWFVHDHALICATLNV
jgi:hypothetical protein